MPKIMWAKSKTSRRLIAILTAVAIVFGGVAAVMVRSVEPARATCAGTHCDAQGTLELAGSGWLGGKGVNVYANTGSAGYDSGVNDYVTVGKASVLAGEEWQCVELINRLYLTQGWITGTWSGNGNQLYANAPSGLSKEANGSITSLNPGDVITLDDGGSGHAGIVNSVSGSTVSIVNQNTVSVYSSASFSNKTLTMSGWAGYTVQGVIHAPSSSSNTSTNPSPPLLTSLVTSDGVQHVYSGTATGSLFETWWGPSSPSPTTWQVAGVGSAITGISAQVTADGNEHVYYGTASGTVGEVWWGPNSGGVHNGQSYNIAAAVTALSSQVTPDGVQHIYSADAAGSLFETWWGSSPATTSQIYNTGVDIVGISSQVTSDGTEHLFFGATNGEVGEVWWNATSGGGHLGATANVNTNVTAVSSQITADGVRHIYSANSVGGLDETWWGPNSSGPATWQVANVGHHPTAISSQITSDGIEHIYYGTSFGQFGEVWWNANGVHLGQTYSDPAGVSDSAISSQLTAGGTQQNIYAVNTAGTLFALWWGSDAATTSAVGQVS